MNEKSLRILEYNKIIEMLSSKAYSKAGKLLCDGLKPIDNLNEVISSLQNTDDALKRLLRNGNVSFAGNKDIRQSLLRLKKGSSLNALELLLICDLLEASSRVKSYLKKEHPDDEDDSLDKYYAMLEPLTKHSLEIRRCIISEDEIADDASSELKAIRRHIKGTNDKIHSELTRMVNTTYRTYL